jgi:hypothetical protein
MISFCRLAWGYSAKAGASLGAILDLSSPVLYFLFSFRIKKLLNIVFLTQFVPHCIFFYFLNMQKSWAGQSKLHSKNKATATQYDVSTSWEFFIR